MSFFRPLYQDGIDYAATTIQSNYERIPFLFTVKDLVAKASAGGNQVKPGFQMGGGFRTPSYRTGLFLDPKGRGGSTGYDMAVALPGLQSGVEGDAEMFKENNKVFDVTDGNIEFEVNNVDKEAGEIGGACLLSRHECCIYSVFLMGDAAGCGVRKRVVGLRVYRMGLVA